MNKTIYVHSTFRFDRDFQKYTRRNKKVELKIIKTLKQLALDPFNVGLRTHKVESRLFGETYSTRVSGDIRIVWIFEKDNLIILLLSLGGHCGKHKVYK